MFGFSSLLPPDWVRLRIPAFLVIYTVLPSAIYTARHRSSKGNWYIPPEPTDESPSMQAKLLLLNSLAVLFSLITVVIYHYENRGIIKPAIPLSVLWGTTTLTTLYYTTSTHDISHEIYLVSSLLMFMLEWASPRTPVESVSFTATTPGVTQSNDTSQTEKVSTEESKHSKSE
ncbi:hypothetical protein RhiirA5_364070 [Rhizophagus irregularis]|uniref:Uncharacterized protein n=1 Tax=Rhizophagus irregularis TaxID=588596 RepID=A0A2N0P6S9_9GLOM|nr:hypothetical protein RhiirA5_364070 [Rhizophagus irregularis]